ncbi:helix-turn-helix domain-containing protein [Limnohabitans planktonicus]|uniref:Transcriptional regulator n=1 Tax=Limnohabitans planktonicus II-D5 TaxID=1293045 RepID=A0A2T7UDT9_9BURK|nr:helix-turn-helix transcriptional regulator [Limnohabitans planktonicus]PVE42863.1 transcriptional regulator [Limnohabitans planktonicus II-D5]|eukprot:gene10530-10338_t
MSLQNVTTHQAVLGAVIARLRGESGLKQTDLAEALGITPSAYSRMEKGESAMSTEQLRLLAERLKVTASHILELTDEASAALSENSGVSVKSLSREAWGAGAMVAAGFMPIAGAALGALVGNLLQKHFAKGKKNDEQ